MTSTVSLNSANLFAEQSKNLNMNMMFRKHLVQVKDELPKEVKNILSDETEANATVVNQSPFIDGSKFRILFNEYTLIEGFPNKPEKPIIKDGKEVPWTPRLSKAFMMQKMNSNGLVSRDITVAFIGVISPIERKLMICGGGVAEFEPDAINKRLASCAHVNTYEQDLKSEFGCDGLILRVKRGLPYKYEDFAGKVRMNRLVSFIIDEEIHLDEMTDAQRKDINEFYQSLESAIQPQDNDEPNAAQQ